MKKFILIFALSIGVASFANTANAQNVNISINIGSQPAWGPVGYDYVNYYYFPDIDCYYDINQSVFVYYNSGSWMSTRYLPYRYRNYDLYVLHKVVINDSRPWRYNRSHRTQYSRYRGYHGQTVIRDSRESRYHNSRNNNVAWYSSSRDRNRPTTTVNNGRPNSNSSNNRPSVNNSGRPQNNTSRPSNSNPQTTRPSRENSNSGRGNNATSSRPSSIQNTDRSSRSSSSSTSTGNATRSSSRSSQNSSAR